jgi:hypothetical protein
VKDHNLWPRTQHQQPDNWVDNILSSCLLSSGPSPKKKKSLCAQFQQTMRAMSDRWKCEHCSQKPSIAHKRPLRMCALHVKDAHTISCGHVATTMLIVFPLLAVEPTLL